MNQRVSPILMLQKQRALLQAEYEAEKEDFKRLTETVGIRRKVKRGDCWLPLRIGRSYYNSLNQLVVEVFRTEDTEVEHNFEFGRQVMFFRIDANDEIQYFPFSATVSYAEAERMVVAIPDAGCLSQLQGGHSSVGVQLSFDETTYRLMMEALERVMRAKGNRLAQLRDIFYNRSETEKFTFAPMRFPWLNPTQEHAVNEVLLAKDVAIVHGPPGTGKTTTLVEAIFETLRRENQVLVCAQSNMAVDWISERLVDRGVEVLRIGNPTKVNDKMLSFTYERRFESHPDYPSLWALRKAIREMQGRKKRGDHGYHDKLDRLKSRATELEVRINASLFGSARVIACTLAGSASRVLSGMKFGTLFIDEAAQALEAACWIAIRKAHRVILAGDHCQLPPTVKSIEALKGGLGTTLMERIVKSNPQVVTLLKMQYRMNEEIMRFSSDWFYGGQVQSAPDVKYRSILDFDTPMMWIDTSDMGFKEQFVGESFGRINRDEAILTLQTLQDYFTKIGRQHVLEERIDVGIISPYRAQVQFLRKMIRATEFFKPYRHLISVNTVDGFQGQERDVILISLVRANDDGEIGFLRDLRRMNVAITRARMKLIILGEAATLTRHPFYARLHEHIRALSEE
ncbi:MAG: AAA domain-containing protein [Bacteroidales bacterium]|nr:AAA domain-containing protein [Bacteroidales bacterium]